MDLFINLLVVQAIMGAFDTLYHHEFKVALPRCPGAKMELAIHAVRAVLYGLVFLGVAWFEWHGMWVILLVVIILIEVLLTLWDFVIEDQTRVLPQSERITHTLLAINGGAAFVLLATELPRWYAFATDFVWVDYGWQSWFLSVAAIGVALSGVRDGFAAWALKRLDLSLSLDIGAHRRILISGGTGFIGSALCRELLLGHHHITILTRRPVAASLQFGGKVKAVRSTQDLSSSEKFDVIINLAGAPVVGLPWTTRRRRILLQSRVKVTEDLLTFVERAVHRPDIWIQASAIGYYGTHSEKPADESSGRGQGFAAELCHQWESLTDRLRDTSVRCVILRFGLVFGRSGGAFPMMQLPYRLGLGSILGNGQQYMGWIHLEDLLRLIAYAVREQSLQGVINAVAPEQPAYADFARILGKLLHRPVLFKIPEAILRRLLGEMASMFVDGPRILPSRLTHCGFEYRFPSLRSALMDLA